MHGCIMASRRGCQDVNIYMQAKMQKAQPNGNTPNNKVIILTALGAGDRYCLVSLGQDHNRPHNPVSRHNSQGTSINTPCKTSELAYAVTPRKDRELWCTRASWAGGSPEPINSTTVEVVRQSMLPRMDLTPTSMQEQAHQIAVLHEGTNLGIPAAASYDMQQSEEGVEGREVGEKKGELVYSAAGDTRPRWVTGVV
jgi:hypothetical protein